MGGEKGSSKMLGGASQGRQLSIYVPSKDKDGEPVDHAHWKKTTMAFMTRVFGRCTAMPQLQGIWADEDGTTLDETVNIVFSYVDKEELSIHAEEVRSFLIELGTATQQAEVGYEYDGEFFTIQM